MKKSLLTISIMLFLANMLTGQICTPLGNQTTYGTNNVWRGYVYDNINLTTYKGYVTEGTSANPNFDESFGGENVSYATNGCPVNTNTFSVRYKLTKTFTNAIYEFVVGGDDGFRLSLDGGSTGVINQWVEQSYTSASYAVQLNGTYNMILEFYDNGSANRISFSVSTSCTGVENTTTYGTGNAWKGYIYDGTSFNTYRGMIQRGSGTGATFDESFGGPYTTFATSSCTAVETETFSVRFRLKKSFTAGLYTFFIGGDDGFRLSLDGGNTYVINNWNDHSYGVSSYSATLSGTYNMVLDYYENGGDNRINFTVSPSVALPINLISFTGKENDGKSILNWETTASSNPEHFEIEKSTDGTNYKQIGNVNANTATTTETKMAFQYTDAAATNGKSYYRLKMIDKTGVITFSNTVTITIAAAKADAISIFPTVITSNSLSLQAGRTIQQATITVVDMNGRVMSRQTAGKLAIGQTIQFAPAASTLQRGIYIVNITDKDEVVGTKRFIVQ